MKPKGPVRSARAPHGQTLCLLLLVMAACLWLPCEGNGYEGFFERHVDYPKSNYGDDDSYCDEMMQRRGMSCWHGNTFVHASKGELQSLCGSKGFLAAEMERSLSPFPITVCSRTVMKPRESCRYDGQSLIAEIWVTCQKGLPVHFNKYG